MDERSAQSEVYFTNHNSVYLPDLCLLKILEYTDAKTVYNFSRCNWASMYLVNRNIARLPRPQIRLEIDPISLYSERWFTGETMSIEVERDDDTPNTSKWILEVAILRDFTTPWEHHFKFMYKHIATGLLILCDNELSVMIEKHRYWNTEFRINECTISEGELSFCRALINAVKPVVIHSAHIVEALIPNGYCRVMPLRLQFEWVDDKWQRCLQYWNDFWNIADCSTSTQTSNAKYIWNSDTSVELSDLVADYVLRLFIDNQADKCRLRLPPIPIETALRIARRVIKLWPLSKKIPHDTAIAVPIKGGGRVGRLNLREAVGNAQWHQFGENTFMCHHRIYAHLLLVSLNRQNFELITSSLV